MSEAAPASIGSGRYDPVTDEPRWIGEWLRAALARDGAGEGEPFAIAVPPPNVTGRLHMGHALNQSTQDVLIRYHRMAGRPTRWINGTDHAGIATQAVVEKQLAAEGITRQELGREEFVKRVWAWRETSGGEIIEQSKRLGSLLDYRRERFTMDEAYAKAVVEVFVCLHEKGYIYRDRYMVNWDPGLCSAISDLEVEDREVTDSLVEIAYPLSDGSGEVVVATVRPETMLGDAAVAVNPTDDRYRALVGKTVTLPLVGREIPIVADDYVDVAFGTGCLKVTPAHDPNDFEIGRRHGLEQITVIGEDGNMTAEAGAAYAGLPSDEARGRVLKDLAKLGLVRKETPYTHTVPFSQRSGMRVEPLISLQWFCDMTKLAGPAVDAVTSDAVRFHPDRWKRVYLNWMDEIRPWCISRQLWWGHQIPVWYRGDEVHVGAEAPEGEGWVRDPDVLDTWFSSALWPFATLGWPEKTADLERFYPTQVLSTARDIIFLWVARMIMMGIEFTGEIPFSDVIMHSVIQAPDGRRMSKSLGTGVDPIEMIAAHGADATRFGLLLMSSQQDVRFAEDKIRQGRQLVTKLWNATSLVIARGGSLDGDGPDERTLADKWMISRAGVAIGSANGHIVAFDFSALADTIYHTIFDDFCDWYLEFLKAGQATPKVAAQVLEQLLALAHPMLPFVTEACWERLPGAKGLMVDHESAFSPGGTSFQALREVSYVKEVVTATRAWRTERGVSPREELLGTIEGQTLGSPEAAALSGSLASIRWEQVAGSAASMIPLSSGRLLLSRVDVAIDPEAEHARLTEAIARAQNERARSEGMLANERFVSRAPAELVEAERAKLARFAAEAAALQVELDALGQ